MSQGRGKRNRGHHGKKVNIGDKGKEILGNIDENNPVIKQFEAYAAELDKKHDRYEKIVKIGRDITIESKKIIFLLHKIDKESTRQNILASAKLRLDTVAEDLFSSIAWELENQDPYQYLRAYQPGLEEYIEAVTFYQYLESGTVQDWTHLEKALTYIVCNKCDSTEENTPLQAKTINTLITPHEYILGIADLTGELMRKSISNLAMDLPSCYQICKFVKNTYKGFLGCTSQSNKKINRKIYTLKQNLQKTEQVCYTIEVIGSEATDLVLTNTHKLMGEENEDDEGYDIY